MMRATEPHGPVYDHLHRLTGDRGLFEHALYAEPRPEHGYCVDDAARGLIVVTREPDVDAGLRRLGAAYLDLVLDAVEPDGKVHNRRALDGTWTDEAGVGDWWGRALWGLGVAAAHGPTGAVRARALMGFRLAAVNRSPHVRAMVFAGLGAGELLLARPDDVMAAELLAATTGRLLLLSADAGDWPWPEPRLTYANGALAECLLLSWQAVDDRTAGALGLELLDFLLETETLDGRLSVTPVGGRGPGDTGPAFDQQAIEVAALADACARADRLAPDQRWRDGVAMAWAWFTGDNDAGTPMYDPTTGGGYDGLQRTGPNLNQGAESTLAMLATAQRARALGLLG